MSVKQPQKTHTFFIYPNSSVELLELLTRYEALCKQHPETDFEVVLFFWTLTVDQINNVLFAPDPPAAAEEMHAWYVNALD